MTSKDITPNSQNLLDIAFNNLSEEDKKQLMKKAVQGKLDIEIETAKAGIKYNTSSAEMHAFITDIHNLEMITKSDYKIENTHATASGRTTIEVKKTTESNTLFVRIVAVCALALIAFYVITH